MRFPERARQSWRYARQRWPEEFDWREISCRDESSAKDEMRRQQELDDPDEAEWIYLRNKTGHWVARRTPRHMGIPGRRPSVSRTLFAEFLDHLLG
jgi:hypothetical protein